jgi:hypothetical protein
VGTNAPTRLLTTTMRSAIMCFMASEPHVTLSGDIVGEYVVEDQQPGGRLVIVPDTYPTVTYAEMLERSGGRPATPEEFADFVAEYGPFRPPDGEG